MGAITEHFANLTQWLLADHQAKGKNRSDPSASSFLVKAVSPLLLSGLRAGPGMVVDIKDRHVGPFDGVVSLDRFPVLGQGPSASYLADGVVFCLDARTWAVADLTSFGERATYVKKLERKKSDPIYCFAAAFDPLSLEEVSQFLKGPAGQDVDGVLTLGRHAVVRNRGGWFGPPDTVPFVTARSGPEAMKSISFLFMQLMHSALGLPFSLADYQHL